MFYTFVVEPASIKARQGRSVTLHCRSRRVDWRLNNTYFVYKYQAGEITSHYQNRSVFESTSEDQGDLILTHVTPADEGVYTCFAANGGPSIKKYSLKGNLKYFFTFFPVICSFPS